MKIIIEGTNSRELKKKLIQTQVDRKSTTPCEGKFKPDTYLYKWGDSKASLLQKMENEQILLLKLIGKIEENIYKIKI